MKQEQNRNRFGKKLAAGDMKKLYGGALPAGVWVCTADDYQCYRNQAVCQAACSNPTSCRKYTYCP